MSLRSARVTATGLSRIWSRAQSGVTRLDLPALLDALGRGRLTGAKRRALRAVIRQAHEEAAVMAYSAQARALGTRGEIPTEVIRTIRDRADGRATFVLQRFRGVRAGLTPGRLRAWLELSIGEATKSGADEGQELAAVVEGATFKTWVRTGPAKEPRRSHTALEGMTIPIDETFPLEGGVNVRGPRDPNVPSVAAEWANCHHSLVYSRGARR